MQTIDIHAEHNRLCDLIEDLETRLGGQYDPRLDDFQWEAATLRWQICHA